MEAVKCEAFLAAAELGSLTATAELLGYTQSGVTRMIGTLEEELGFPLFLRSKKGVQLTENGKLMLPLLREVVRAHHNAEQLSAEIGGVSKGSLTIGCYYSISALWMPEILTAFRARYPGVTVRMQEGGNLEMARWLNERSVDCCFGAQMHGDKYDWLPVFRDELVAWLPRGHELAEADAFPLMRLQNEPFIHTSPNHDTDQDRLLEQLDAAGNLRFALGAAYDEAAARALLAELGLGDAGGKRVRDWSGGMKRRLALARALLAPSDALALDEPFTGLDADNRAAAQRCVARAAREKIVLLVSHEDDALAGAEVRLQ